MAALSVRARILLLARYLVLEMNAMVEAPHFTTSSASQSRVWPMAALLFLGLVWLEVIHQLQAEWSVNPQYSYGWSVPLLVCYLLWKRWADRPSPTRPALAFIPVAISVFCAVLFLPIRFVAEANPDWRLLSWSLSLVAVAISICLIFLSGGWPWVRYFAFPFLFFLVAVPWPTGVEEIVTQNLMRAVSAINVALVNAIGIPAVQHGNVIETTSGLIGIEEACSGVRSLQATFMISLFLGELFSFRLWPRLILVAAGAALAFFCNVIRTAILVWVGASRGTHAIEGWHDPAGLIILAFCLLGLGAFGLFMQRWPNAVTRPPTLGNKRGPLRPPGGSSLVVSLIAWLLLAEAGVQSWYHLHNSALTDSRWAVQWPVSGNEYKTVPVGSEAESLLRYDEGGAATWKGGEGHHWMMFFFRWAPGRTAARFVKVHRPDICLPASGLTMVRDHGIRLIEINGVHLPIRSYRFDNRGVPLHVFYCYWDARSSYESEEAANEEDWTAQGRLRAALRGRRERGAQMLEVVVWDYKDEAEASAALQRQLAQIVRPG
jgi:exosortase